jgi:hypothetical protein
VNNTWQESRLAIVLYIMEGLYFRHMVNAFAARDTREWFQMSVDVIGAPVA